MDLCDNRRMWAIVLFCCWRLIPWKRVRKQQRRRQNRGGGGGGEEDNRGRVEISLQSFNCGPFHGGELCHFFN